MVGWEEIINFHQKSKPEFCKADGKEGQGKRISIRFGTDRENTQRDIEFVGFCNSPPPEFPTSLDEAPYAPLATSPSQ
jgi:hypothetical protein